MVVTRMKPTQKSTTTVMPMTAMTTPKTMPRAATMAGRMALSLTVATTVSTASRARSASASPRSFSATAWRLPGSPGCAGRHDVADAHRVGSGVGPDPRAEVDRDQRVLGVDVGAPGQHVGEVVAGAVGHGQPLQRRVGPHLRVHVGQRLGPGPLLGLLGHLAVLELNDRLDVQQRTEERSGATDPAAALEMLGPAQPAVDAGAGDAVLGGGYQLVQAGTGCGLFGGGDDEQSLAHGERIRINDADGHRAERVGRGDGGTVGSRHLGGDGQAEDGVGTLVDGLRESGLEGAGGGGGGRRQVTLAAATLPELGRGELAAVLELLVAEADRQRHDDDVVLLDELVGQVAGTVGDDVDAGHARVCHGGEAGPREAARRAWAARRRKRAPAARTPRLVGTMRRAGSRRAARPGGRGRGVRWDGEDQRDRWDRPDGRGGAGGG